MAITTEQQTRILQMTQAMFGAAPGATYLSQFESNVAAGTSVADLAQALSGTIAFYGTSYSASLSAAQFADAFINDLVGSHASTVDKAWATSYIVDRMATGATQTDIVSELTMALSSVSHEDANWGAAATYYNTNIATRIIDNLVGSSATAAAKVEVVNYIVGQIAAGQTIGNMIDLAITALDNMDHTDGTWGNAAALLDNRVEVSRYYSVNMAGAATDLGTLQQALAAVTSSTSSVAMAKAIFDTPMSGRAQDGYISGATVFVDLNGDGIRNPGEARVTTDAQGNFTLPARAFGKIIVTGGTDIGTNLPFSGSFTAPAGSTVVNPLTTLVQAMVEQGSDLSEAMTQVQTALGLSADIDFTTFDPISEMSGANAAQAGEMLAAAVQVNNLLAMAASAMTGAEAGLSMETASAQVVTALTAQMAGASAVLDLADATMLNEVILASAGQNTTLAVSIAHLSGDIAQMVADNNGSIADIMASGGTRETMLSQIMQVATVAQGDASTALLNAIAGGTSLAGIRNDYTGAAFDALVNHAALGDANGDGTIDRPIVRPDIVIPDSNNNPQPDPTPVNTVAILSADVANLTETNSILTTTGTLTISDVDSPETFVAQAAAVGTYGTLGINTAGAWTYTTSSAHDEFVAGTTYTDIFGVASADGTQTSVTVNILATNDAAILSADMANLTETNSILTTTGTLTISDVDSPATFVAQTATVGTYGTFGINTAGAWTYTTSSAQDEFAADTTYTDSFSVASADGTQTSVTVNILGTADMAILSAGVANLTETNAGLTTSGTLTISDVDSPATFVAQTATVGTYGTFGINTAGAWTYTTSSAHDEFAAGTTYTDMFSVASADGTPTSVTVNILGTVDNQVPIISGTSTRNLTEDSNVTPIVAPLKTVTGFYPGGSGSKSITVADVNGDGNADIITANVGNSATLGTNVSVLLNDGIGTFSTSSLYEVGALGPNGLAVADVNADGYGDIITANSGGSSLSVLLNNGAGAFGVASVYGAGVLHGALEIAVADVNGDGNADIVTTGYSTLVGSVRVGGMLLLGDGTGTFGPASPYSESYSGDVSVVDVTGDGNVDIVTIGAYNVVSVQQGNGAGTFGVPNSYNVGGDTLQALAVTDVNGDGYADIVAAHWSANGTVSVLLGNGAGVFGPPLEYNGNAVYPLNVVVTDMNGDGNADIITGDYFSGAVSVLWGNGAGDFSTKSRYDTRRISGATMVAGGDLNNDGNSDIVTVQFEVATGGVLLNNTTGGDLVASGSLSINDPDAGQSSFVAQTGTMGNHGFGRFNITAAGAWSYSASNGQAAIQALNAGQSVTDSFIVTSFDGTATQTVTITILGTNEVVAPTGLDLGAADDTGSSDSDNLTQNTTGLTIHGAAEAGNTVRLYDTNGTTLLGTGTVTGGVFSIDVNLAAGSHTITAKATDAANNTSIASTGLAITVDTTAPTTTQAPSASGTTSGGTTLAATINESGTGYYLIQAAADAAPNAATVIAANNTFAMNANTQATASISGLVASTAYKVYFVATDIAGNIQTSVGSVAVTTSAPADVIPPAAPTGLDLLAADDTGCSDSDGITQNTTGLTISGAAEEDSTVELYDTNGTTLLGTGTATGGVFSIDVNLAAGSHTITAKATDAANNTSIASTGLAITVDTTAPTTTITSGDYNSSTNILTVTGANFDTLLSAGETDATDIKDRLDWSKLVWDINGDDAVTANAGFALADISSVLATNGTTLTVTLTDAAATALEAMAGYGGAGGADTLDVTAGFSVDAAGTTATTDNITNGSIATSHAGDAIIDLGASGKLIAPVQVNGRWYYFWDRSGDGTSANGVDYCTHDTLDDIFIEDVNGGGGGGGNTTDTYRYATISGVRVALPTQGDGGSLGSGAWYYLADNGNYTDLAEIWDASNTGYQTAGLPSGWAADAYLSATPSSSGHAVVFLGNGFVNDNLDGGNSYYVALEVLGVGNFP